MIYAAARKKALFMLAATIITWAKEKKKVGIEKQPGTVPADSLTLAKMRFQCGKILGAKIARRG